MASYDIWLNFMNDDANSKDVRINYYFRGPSVGLIMDIEIQRLSNNRHSLELTSSTLDRLCELHEETKPEDLLKSLGRQTIILGEKDIDELNGKKKSNNNRTWRSRSPLILLPRHSISPACKWPISSVRTSSCADESSGLSISTRCAT